MDEQRAQTERRSDARPVAGSVVRVMSLDGTKLLFDQLVGASAVK
jgi:hypothetical protein